MIGKRTGLDFSNHKITVTENEHLKMYDFKEPGTRIHSLRFINVGGIMAVTGDFSNWMFCREFIPGKDGTVSDYYWLEKLSIHSTQQGEEFDEEETEKDLKKLIDGGYAEDYEGEKLEQMIEYAKSCLSSLEDGEIPYKHTAFSELPSFCDFESVISNKKIKTQLLCVFDGFEQMCLQMKEQQIKV